MRKLALVVWGMTASAGVLIAVAGMFRFSLLWIVLGVALYVLGGAFGERLRSEQPGRH